LNRMLRILCGELRWVRLGSATEYGSSPRVRGTQPCRRRHLGARRIIPACAGNSSGRSSGPECRSDHPRVCGELATASIFMSCWRGSSPRVRGTHHHGVGRRRASRIIPACAGNSGSARTKTSTPSDHPRVCGELTMPGLRSSGASGSSPRVRGTHGKRPACQAAGRIIPACAGNSKVWRKE